MAKCKFCGEPVKAAPVFHTGCWVQRASKVAELRKEMIRGGNA